MRFQAPSASEAGAGIGALYVAGGVIAGGVIAGENGS
jgi:hypothetical protein